MRTSDQARAFPLAPPPHPVHLIDTCTFNFLSLLILLILLLSDRPPDLPRQAGRQPHAATCRQAASDPTGEIQFLQGRPSIVLRALERTNGFMNERMNERTQRRATVSLSETEKRSLPSSLSLSLSRACRGLLI
mmetsp:Transcript_29752/g.58398  ORF Transcript_29752/g.58398 Transcript_29752/m.58398 type:complete len:134 (+) Transcript_29752:364-765(+)